MLSSLAPAVRATSSSYTKEQALLALNRAEESPGDAMSDFKVVQDCMRPNDQLEDTTNNFVRLLNSYGRQNTSTVQQDFRTLAATRKDNESLSQLTDQWLTLRPKDTEDDVRAGWAKVSADLKDGEPRQEALGQYMRVLDLEGYQSTSSVLSHYQTVNDNLKPGESRSEATDQFIRQFKADTPSDAVSNYLLVDRTLRQGETRAQATDQFLRVLSKEGYQNTSQAESHYQIIHNSLRSDESRSNGIDQFFRQYQADTLSDAVGNYELVDKSMKTGESRAQVTDQFLRLLSKEGYESTSEARQDFSAIDGLISADKGRQSLTDSFLKFRADAGPSQARQMFLLANS